MEIANLKVYNDNMRKSLLDKAYFLSFVDSDTFIDFGCADGSLLKHIHDINGLKIGLEKLEKIIFQ